jgi:hypothetical protein
MDRALVPFRRGQRAAPFHVHPGLGNQPGEEI